MINYKLIKNIIAIAVVLLVLGYFPGYLYIPLAFIFASPFGHLFIIIPFLLWLIKRGDKTDNIEY